MKKQLFAFVLTLAATMAMAQVKVDKVHHRGPYRVQPPMLIDSVDASQKKYSKDLLLDTRIAATNLEKAPLMSLSQAPTTQDKNNTDIYLAAFDFQVKGYAKVEVSIKGPKLYKVFVNDKATTAEQPYQPGQYRVMVKYVADTAALQIELKTKDSLNVALSRQGAKRPFSMADNMEMKHYSGVSLSASGKYARVGKSWFNPDGSSHYEVAVKELATGREMAMHDYYGWMPQSDKYLSVRKEDGRRRLYAVDPATNAADLLCADLPEGSFTMSPTEDFLIINEEVKGPEKEKGVYEILVPDDRQPGFRNRNKLSKLDLNTGILQPLTFGNKNVWMYDISHDGRYMIFGFSHDRLTQRPTTLTTVCRMNLHTLQVDTLIREDGFISGIDYIPGTNRLLITGSAEAFNRLGCTLPENLTPNQFEHQLFLYDIDTKSTWSLSRDFDPSLKSVYLSNNGLCFFTAENKDSVSLYQLKLDRYPHSITKVDQPCEVIGSCALASNGSTMIYYGSGACTADRLYRLAIGKSGKLSVSEIEDLNAERMAQINLGTCQGFEFKSRNGYPISGHYYLPADFDASKKYPVIVHYYGGCSPTARRFGGGSHYPAHYWNANGYIVLIVNPGGASGFGQEWGARHVNTMGEGIAEDIIEATEWFARNSWVNQDKIGCVSASYGGFMTQLLLTKTDLFATGISHAGISDHTSYWGEGYWGYSYSEVSAANSYPWTRKDLFVDRSPLYNANKIHRPLLFTHGTADTNVPIGESIQMYTALKLLGVPTAFVMVEGENHGIMDFTKRQQWINTMVAWFNRWLQDDPTWWNAIYSPKEL
ncbi:MAG: prolyl oligopeptidase family serine peptidase [Bacteroidales bacterium]|nr:prolyl oligopeptidase family serine peptidase [Bacteroidales bacterium]